MFPLYDIFYIAPERKYRDGKKVTIHWAKHHKNLSEIAYNQQLKLLKLSTPGPRIMRFLGLGKSHINRIYSTSANYSLNAKFALSEYFRIFSKCRTS